MVSGRFRQGVVTERLQHAPTYHTDTAPNMQDVRVRMACHCLVLDGIRLFFNDAIIGLIINHYARINDSFIN